MLVAPLLLLAPFAVSAPATRLAIQSQDAVVIGAAAQRAIMKYGLPGGSPPFTVAISYRPSKYLGAYYLKSENRAYFNPGQMSSLTGNVTAAGQNPATAYQFAVHEYVHAYMHNHNGNPPPGFGQPDIHDSPPGPFSGPPYGDNGTCGHLTLKADVSISVSVCQDLGPNPTPPFDPPLTEEQRLEACKALKEIADAHNAKGPAEWAKLGCTGPFPSMPSCDNCPD